MRVIRSLLTGRRDIVVVRLKMLCIGVCGSCLVEPRYLPLKYSVLHKQHLLLPAPFVLQDARVGSLRDQKPGRHDVGAKVSLSKRKLHHSTAKLISPFFWLHHLLSILSFLQAPNCKQRVWRWQTTIAGRAEEAITPASDDTEACCLVPTHLVLSRPTSSSSSPPPPIAAVLPSPLIQFLSFR